MQSTEHKAPLDSILKVGETLPADIYAANGLLLLRKGHYVLNEKQRERLVALGMTHPASALPPVESDLARISGEFSPFEEIQYAARHLDYLLGAGLSARGFEQRVRALANRLIAFTEKAPDGMLASLLLVPLAKYSSAHSIHVGIILAVLTRRLELEHAARNSLISAALTMNLSIASLMDELHHQSSPLSQEQRNLIEGHPLLSSAMLRELGIADELWHLLVQTHHEKWDGKGYPYRLDKENIESLSHLLHLADVTAAKLVPRTYRSAMKPNTALAQIFMEANALFDYRFTSLLVKELGIYPPGSFVQLANQEMGVVLSRRERADEPCVAVLRRNDGAPYNKPQLREASAHEYRILQAIDQKQIGIRPQYLASLWTRHRSGSSTYK